MTTTLLAPKEVASRLGVSVKTLMRIVEGGGLAYIDVGSRKRHVHRFTEEQLHAFLKRQEFRAAPTCPPTDVKKNGKFRYDFEIGGRRFSGALAAKTQKAAERPKKQA